MYAGKTIAVVIPAFCEQALIGETLRGLPEFVDRVYVVDDASPDQTWQKLRELGEARLVRIRHGQNRGVGAAIVSGYYRALLDDADVIAVMAGDNQMAPEDLSAVVLPIVNGAADYVKGNRFRHPLARQMPTLRRWAGRSLAWLTRLCTGLRVSDTQCGYTAIAASCAGELALNDLWPRYGYPNDLLALLARAGARVTEVPVRPVYASEKSGIRPWHALQITGLILKRRLQSHP